MKTPVALAPRYRASAGRGRGLDGSTVNKRVYSCRGAIQKLFQDLHGTWHHVRPFDSDTGLGFGTTLG